MLIYVDSPFQLLQSYELINKKPYSYKLYIRLNGNKENDRQLRKLSSVLGFTNVKFFKINNLPRKFIYYFFICFKTAFAKKVYFGDANSKLFSMVKKVCAPSRIIILDDGVATINNPLENMQFKRFTIFPYLVQSPIINNFSCIRSFLQIKGKRKLHVIVGGKLVEENICSSNDYYSLLDQIICNITKTQPEAEILYVAHRGENSNNLKEMSELFDFKIVRNDLPVELLEYELDVEILSISSVISTALYSFRVIYPNLPIFVCKPDDHMIKSRVDAVESIYSLMKAQKKFTFIGAM